MKNLIRHIAFSPQGDLLATADWHGATQIWNVSSRSEVSRLKTLLDFGGNRLAVSAAHAKCYTASYEEGIVSAYNIGDGKVCWQRNGIRRVQKIFVGVDEKRLYCMKEDGGCELLDAGEGSTVGRLPKIRRMWTNGSSGHYCVDREGKYIEIVDQEFREILKIKKQSFGVLDVCFHEGYVALSEAGDCVRCIEVSSGKEVFRSAKRDNWHVIHLGLKKDSKSFFGIHRNYNSGGDVELVTFPCDDGMKILSMLKDEAEYKFSPNDSLLVSSGKKVHDLAGTSIQTSSLK